MEKYKQALEKIEENTYPTGVPLKTEVVAKHIALEAIGIFEPIQLSDEQKGKLGACKVYHEAMVKMYGDTDRAVKEAINWFATSVAIDFDIKVIKQFLADNT